MSRIVSHAAIAAAALVAGGLGATAFSSPERTREGGAAATRPLGPEEVRTVVITKTIHRVRHVRVNARRAAPAGAPAPAAAAVIAVQPAPARLVVSRPLRTRSSGHGSAGGGGEREGGRDD